MHAILLALAATACPGATLRLAARDLASPDFAARERASARLVSLDPRALPAVRRLLAGPLPVEAAGRLRVAVDRLELKLLTEPRRVTIDVKGAPLAEVLAELSRQTGFSLTCAKPTESSAVDPAKPVRLRAEAVPFLQAFDDLCETNELYFDADKSGVIVVHADHPRAPIVRAYAGPYRCVLSKVSREAQLDLVPMQGGIKRWPDRVYLGLGVSGEPGVRMLPLSAARVVSAVDARGRPIDFPEPSGDPKEPYAGWADVAVGFNLADRRGEVLKRLTLAVTVAAEVEERAARAPDLVRAKGTTLTAGGLSLTLTRVSVDRAKRTAEFEAELLAPADSEWARFGRYIPERLRVVDAAGRSFDQVKYEIDTSGDGPPRLRVGFAMRAEPTAAGPVALEFLDWRVRERELHFVFNNVPLP